MHKIVDLGAWWHADTGLPTPLGVNAVRKDLGKQLMRKLSQLLTDSIRYGLDHREEAVAYGLVDCVLEQREVSSRARGFGNGSG